VLVTGGGAGLGRAIAKRASADGYDVLVADLDVEAATETTDIIRRDGGAASAVYMDVSEPTSVSEAVGQAVRQGGNFYGLVNNAGFGQSRPFLEITLKEWEKTLSVNTTGAFLVTKEVLPGMLEEKRGCIVNVSSIAGKDAWPNWISYAVSKHGLIGFTRGLAREFGRSGIRVNAVCPGAIKTAIWEAGPQGTDDPDALYNLLAERTSLGCGQTAEDVAAAVSFLLSSESSKITGVSLSVDSGLLFN
jgi:3-oxoacyl-[acyl-carrier protein] reductase